MKSLVAIIMVFSSVSAFASSANLFLEGSFFKNNQPVKNSYCDMSGELTVTSNSGREHKVTINIPSAQADSAGQIKAEYRGRVLNAIDLGMSFNEIKSLGVSLRGYCLGLLDKSLASATFNSSNGGNFSAMSPDSTIRIESKKGRGLNNNSITIQGYFNY